MIGNYIKTAFRNIRRHKGYAFININGLAIGMSCCILISLFILHQLSYDKYHEHAEQIYRLCSEIQMGKNITTLPISNAPVGPVLKNDYPEVLSAVRLKIRGRIPIKYKDRLFYEDRIFWADSSFFTDRISVDADFFPTLGMEIVKGRNFSRDFSTDPDHAVIINETAAKAFGWEEPLGKTIKRPTGSTPGTLQWETRTVVGVVKDFHIRSLRQIVTPLYITNTPRYLNILSIKIRGFGQAETLDRIRDMWKIIDPGRPFDYFFLGDTFDSQYRYEEKLGNILTSFSVFAVFVACLGLFGMASFATERRKREIGIRKVLGASVSDVLFLLTKDFIKAVILANLIAWPLAYFIMRNWLQNFAYRTQIGIGVFLLTGLLSLFISLLTVSFQSVRAALSDPAQAVKYE